MALVVKNLPANAGDLRDTGSSPGLGRSPAGKKVATHSSILPRESDGQRTLVSYSPQGHNESDMTEAT